MTFNDRTGHAVVAFATQRSYFLVFGFGQLRGSPQLHESRYFTKSVDLQQLTEADFRGYSSAIF